MIVSFIWSPYTYGRITDEFFGGYTLSIDNTQLNPEARDTAPGASLIKYAERMRDWLFPDFKNPEETVATYDD